MANVCKYMYNPSINKCVTVDCLEQDYDSDGALSISELTSGQWIFTILTNSEYKRGAQSCLSAFESVCKKYREQLKTNHEEKKEFFDRIYDSLCKQGIFFEAYPWDKNFEDQKNTWIYKKINEQNGVQLCKDISDMDDFMKLLVTKFDEDQITSIINVLNKAIA